MEVAINTFWNFNFFLNSMELCDLLVRNLWGSILEVGWWAAWRIWQKCMRKGSNTLDLDRPADRAWLVKSDKRERRDSLHTIIQWSIFSLHNNFKKKCGHLLIHCGMVSVPLIKWLHTVVETPTSPYPEGQLNHTTVSMVIGAVLLQLTNVVSGGIVHNSANRCVSTSDLFSHWHTCHVTHKWFQMKY